MMHTLQNLAHSPVVERLGWSLLHSLWQGALVALGLAIALRIVRRRGAQASYLACCAALVLAGLAPVLTYALLPGSPRMSEPEAVYLFAEIDRAHAPAADGAFLSGSSDAAIPERLPPETADAPDSAPPSSQAFPVAPAVTLSLADRALGLRRDLALAVAHWSPWLVGLWSLGVVLLSLRNVGGWFAVQGLKSRATGNVPAAIHASAVRLAGKLGLTRAVRLVQSAIIESPMVIGTIRPVILLPACLVTELPPDQLEALLAHELAHVLRHDYLVNLVQTAVETLLFYHPAVWWISSRVRAERENCCDDIAVRLIADRAIYVQALASCATKRAPGLAPAATGGQLIARLRRVLGIADPQGAQSTRWLIGAALLCIAAAGFPLLTADTNSLAAQTEAVALQTTEAKAPAVAETPAPVAPQQQAPKEISGTIVDLAGFPVSNAFVNFAEQLVFRGVQTDLAGRFTITGEPGESKLLIAWSKRSSQMAVIPIAGEMTGDRRYVLDCRDLTARGRVVDASNKAVAGAEVTFHIAGPGGRSYSSKTRQKTDAEGSMGLAWIPAGPGWTVRVSLADGTTTPAIDASAGGELDLPDLVASTPVGPDAKAAPEMAVFSGRVVDEEGRPIAGVRLQLYTQTKDAMLSAREAVTSADGRWSRRLRADFKPYETRLDHPDFVGFHFDRRRPMPPVHTLLDGSAVEVMKRGERIRGTVRDSTGAPVGNALIMAGQFYPRGPEPVEDSTSARTAADGTFSIGGIPRGLHHIVTLADGFAPSRLAVVVQENPPPLSFVVDAGRTVTGRIVDEAGNPVGNASIQAEDWTMPGSFSHSLARETTSGIDGRFTFPGLPKQGAIRFFASPGRGVPRLAIGFEVVSGVDDVGDVPLYSYPVIGGKVLDAESGAPIPKFQVTDGTIRDDGRFAPMRGGATIDSAAGEFRQSINQIVLSVNQETPFAVRISAPGYVPVLTPVVLPGEPYQPLEIRLTKAVSITGRLDLPDGKPAAGAKVFFVGPENRATVQGPSLYEGDTYRPDIRTTAGGDGRFELATPGANGRLLVLHDAGYAVMPAFAFKPDRTTTLTGWARIEGTYRPQGQPRAGATIVAQAIRPLAATQSADHLSFSLKTTTDANGRFIIEHVPALPLRVAASAGAAPGAAASKLVPIEPGRTNVVTLADDGPPLAGRVNLSPAIAAHPPMKGLQFDTSTSWVRAFRGDPAPEAPAGSDAADWAAQLQSVLDGKPSDYLTLPATFADLKADGSFAMDALAPGRYVLLVEIRGERGQYTCGWGLVLGRGRSDFTVAQTAVELPVIELTMPPHPVPGSPAPEITGTTAAGDEFRLSALRGKYVVLDFWAGWCVPCRAAQPALQVLHKRYADTVAFVGLNFDHTDAWARKSIQATRSPWPQLLTAPWDTSNPTLNTWGVDSIPSLWLIDSEGKVLARHLTHEELAELLGRVVGR